MSTRILSIKPASSEVPAHDGEAVVVDLPALQELRASLATASALHGAGRWEEMSPLLEAIGRRLGALLAATAPPDRRGTSARQVTLSIQGQSLMALPWELAADPHGDPLRFLWAPGDSTLLRDESGLRAPGGEPSASPMAMTLLVERPLHFGLSDLTESAAANRAAIERGISHERRAGSTLLLGTLDSAAAAGRPTGVLHLLGHGYETAGIDARFEYGLHCASLHDRLPEDSFGEAPAEQVAQELAGHAPVDVLLLDGCYTAGGFRWDGERWRDPLCTYAGRLGCSVVVSFYDAVNIAQAGAFSRSFYDRLFAGDAPLAAAVAARRALFLAEAGRPLHECVWWKVRIATGPSRSSILKRSMRWP